MQRQLFLVAYDVADPRRLRHALAVVRDHALGGQKSVFECWLNPAERRHLQKRLREVTDPEEDAYFLLRIDPRARVRVLGLGQPPANPRWFLVG